MARGKAKANEPKNKRKQNVTKPKKRESLNARPERSESAQPNQRQKPIEQESGSVKGFDNSVQNPKKGVKRNLRKPQNGQRQTRQGRSIAAQQGDKKKKDEQKGKKLKKEQDEKEVKMNEDSDDSHGDSESDSDSSSDGEDYSASGKMHKFRDDYGSSDSDSNESDDSVMLKRRW